MSESKEMQAKLDVLNKTLGGIEKKHGVGAAMLMGDAPVRDIEAISTGSYMLDKALGIGGIPKGRIIEIFGPESSGKCLVGDTNILTPNGYKTIYELFDEEALTNEMLKGYRDRLETQVEVPVKYPLINKDGEVEYTTHFTINGYKDVYNIRTKNGVKIKATRNHPLLIDVNGRKQWCKASNIKIGDKLVERKTNVNKNLFKSYDEETTTDLDLFTDLLLGYELEEKFDDQFIYPTVKNIIDTFGFAEEYESIMEDVLSKEYLRLIDRSKENERIILLMLIEKLVKEQHQGANKSRQNVLIISESAFLSKTVYRKVILGLKSYGLTTRYIKDYYGVEAYELLLVVDSIQELLISIMSASGKKYYKEEVALDEVEAIEIIRNVPTFDFAMEKTHTFIAEGIVNHNTTLSLHAIAEAQKNGGLAAMVDAEHALDPVYAANLGVDIDHLVLSQPDTGEQALEIVETLARSNVIDIIVVDSVAALVPKAEIDGEMGDSHMALQARLMSQALRKIAGIVSKTNTTIIFINQLRDNIGIMFGSKEVTTGGRALKFYSSVRIDIRRIGALKDGENIIGNETRVRVVKNKVAPPFKEAKFNIIYGEGIDSITELIDLGIEEKIVKKAGSWFTFTTPDGRELKSQGAINFKKELKEDPEMLETLKDMILNPEEEDVEVEEEINLSIED